MSIHAIDFAAAANTDAYLIDTYIPQWLTTHSAWDDPRQSNDPPQLVTGDPGLGIPDHYSGGVWRFAWSASKSVLLDNLVAYTQSYAGDWWRIRWHECFHDETGGCAWTDVRSDGTLPEGI